MPVNLVSAAIVQALGLPENTTKATIHLRAYSPPLIEVEMKLHPSEASDSLINALKHYKLVEDN
jgi:hypothetical protein